MKKVIIATGLLAFAATSFCQQVDKNQAVAQTNYLQKSKKQKKTAWILFGSGAAVMAAGAIIPKGDLTGEISYPCLCEDVHKNDDIKAGFILAGAASMLASIPFFISSGKNKKRANRASVFINVEKRQLLQGRAIDSRSFPVAGIRISL